MPMRRKSKGIGQGRGQVRAQGTEARHGNRPASGVAARGRASPDPGVPRQRSGAPEHHPLLVQRPHRAADAHNCAPALRTTIRRRDRSPPCLIEPLSRRRQPAKAVDMKPRDAEIWPVGGEIVGPPAPPHSRHDRGPACEGLHARPDAAAHGVAEERGRCCRPGKAHPDRRPSFAPRRARGRVP